MDKQKTGLVLSGGGVKGVAHLGVLKALSEKDIKPDIISGASAGALVGALYASGKSVSEMIDFFKKTPLFQWSFLTPRKPGFFDSTSYENILGEILPETFEELSIPLVVTATNIEKATCHYFSEGPLLKPLIASCSIPGIFSPVEIDGEWYSDGGILDNFPVQPLLEQSDFLIGCDVIKPGPQEKEELNSSFSVTVRAQRLLLYSANRHKLEAVDYLFMPALGQYTPIDTQKVEEIYEVAYHYAEDRLKQFPINAVKA